MHRQVYVIQEIKWQIFASAFEVFVKHNIFHVSKKFFCFSNAQTLKLM